MLMIKDDSELDTMLETTNFDNYELIDIPMESDKSLHKLTGVGMAPASDMPSMSGLAPHKRNSRELCPGVDSCQGLLCVLPCMRTSKYVRAFKRSLKTSHENLNHDSFMLASRLNISRKFTPPKIFRYTVCSNDHVPSFD